MPVFLIILLIILLIVALLVAAVLLFFFMPVKLYFRYNDELTVWLKFICFSTQVYPEKEKWVMKEHLPEYKEKKKQAKKQKKSTAAQKTNRKKSPVGDLFEDVLYLLDRLIIPLLSRLKDRLTVRVTQLEVTIGAEDAASSAMLYAAAVNAGYAVFALLDQYFNLKEGKTSCVSVRCPFTESTTSVRFELEFRVRLFDVLFTVLPTLYANIPDDLEQEPQSHKV